MEVNAVRKLYDCAHLYIFNTDAPIFNIILIPKGKRILNDIVLPRSQ